MKTEFLHLVKLFLLLQIIHSCCGDIVNQKLQIGIKKRADDCSIKTKIGDVVHVHYKGIVKSGDEFDNSYVRGQPFTFTLGSEEVIKGWNQGLVGMCLGEQRKLVIPPELAYGALQIPPKIESNATLIFVIELINIERKNEL